MYCGKCGSKLENDATFCPYCGNKIDENKDTLPKKEIKENIAPLQVDNTSLAGVICYLFLSANLKFFSETIVNY